MAARDREAEAASNARMCAHVRVFAHACLRACVLAFLRVCLRLNKTQHVNDASLGMSSTLSTLSAFTNVKVKDVKDEFHQENCLFLATAVAAAKIQHSLQFHQQRTNIQKRIDRWCHLTRRTRN